MKKFILLFSIALITIHCSNENSDAHTQNSTETDIEIQEEPIEELPKTYTQLFVENPTFMADKFDFPVGKPDAKGYYKALSFGESNHLGDDWNATTGGNSDLGHPIYSIGNGYVSFAEDVGGGWGNVIKIVHHWPNGAEYESLYAHCDTMAVTTGDWVKRGEHIGTIGNAHGIYYAHLHLEIRDTVDMPIGGGYSSYTEGYLDPTEFINANRK